MAWPSLASGVYNERSVRLSKEVDVHLGGAFMQLRVIMSQALAAAKPWQRALIGGVALACGIALLLFTVFVPGVLLSVFGGLLLGRGVYGLRRSDGQLPVRH